MKEKGIDASRVKVMTGTAGDKTVNPVLWFLQALTLPPSLGHRWMKAQ